MTSSSDRYTTVPKAYLKMCEISQLSRQNGFPIPAISRLIIDATMNVMVLLHRASTTATRPTHEIFIAAFFKYTSPPPPPPVLHDARSNAR